MWFWIVVAILAAIGEVVSYDLFMASVAGAALITAAVAFAQVPVAGQVLTFSALSLVGIGVLRPAVKHALGIDSMAQQSIRATSSHVIGKRAIVTQAVDANGGQIRIGQGEFWTARTYEPSASIAAGSPVEVVLVEGLTALVEPVADAPTEQSGERALTSNEKGT